MELKYNPEMHRWEVYGQNSVIRGGERQPLFVAEDIMTAAAYIEKVRAEHGQTGTVGADPFPA